MAAARSVSPGGALLRSSRMFALPDPIPPPASNVVALRSPSATQAFPTHQTITTTGDSRARGDWGLKRALPLKTTTRSTIPMLRVRTIDTLEGITDFSSATDYGITLRKFQELRLPISIPAVHAVGSAVGSASGDAKSQNRKSVFEEGQDVTAISVEDRPAYENTRWKFTGPWLGGMGEGDFKDWVLKQVRPRRAEFRKFLKGKLAVELNNEALKRSLDEGGVDDAEPIDAESVTDDQLLLFLRQLRNNNGRLFGFVGQFLDLPPINPPNNLSADQNPYSQNGPPATHPSAGISYLRTSAFLDNHPLYGPQDSHPPVEARVLKVESKGAAGPSTLVGVAGFVTTASPLPMNSGTSVPEVDVRIRGGSKMWVQPYRATVNTTGGIEIDLVKPQNEAIIVAMELLGEDDSKTFGRPVKQQKQKETVTAAMIRGQYVPSGPDAYGLGLGQNRRL